MTDRPLSAVAGAFGLTKVAAANKADEAARRIMRIAELRRDIADYDHICSRHRVSAALRIYADRWGDLYDAYDLRDLLREELAELTGEAG